MCYLLSSKKPEGWNGLARLKRLLWLAAAVGAGLPGYAGAAPHAGEPTGVRLTGHCTLDAYDTRTTFNFEIVMDGFDRYYRREWSDAPPAVDEDGGAPSANPGGHRSEETLELDIGDFSLRNRTGGRSESQVARRLWLGDKFRGVKADELREVTENDFQSEEFSAPVSLDHFPTPCVIKWTEHHAPDWTVTYTVEKVEFIYKHDPGFFDDLLKKYTDLWKKNDTGPGWPPDPKPEWHVQPPQVPASVNEALLESGKNPGDAMKKLRTALARYPLDQPRGVYNQSLLMGDLWQIGGMAEKEELLDWFYHSLSNPPGGSVAGDVGNGAICLLQVIAWVDRPDTRDLLGAMVADARFNQTDAMTVVEMMNMLGEQYPVPEGISLERSPEYFPVWAAQQQLLPLWRNMLRRHYGLAEEKLPGAPSTKHDLMSGPSASYRVDVAESKDATVLKGVSFKIRISPQDLGSIPPGLLNFVIDLSIENKSDAAQGYLFPAWGNVKLILQDADGKPIKGYEDPSNYMQSLRRNDLKMIGFGGKGAVRFQMSSGPMEITYAPKGAPSDLPPWLVPGNGAPPGAKPPGKGEMRVLRFTDGYFATIYPIEGLHSVRIALQYTPLVYRDGPLLGELEPLKDAIFPGTVTTPFVVLDPIKGLNFVRLGMRYTPLLEKGPLWTGLGR